MLLGYFLLSSSGKTLTIGERSGSFPGMPAEMTFRAVLVRANHDVGENVEASPDRTIEYKESEAEVRMQ